MHFSDEHHQFRARVRSVVDSVLRPHIEEWENNGSFRAHEVFPRLAEHGLLGLEYDTAFGGQGLDHLYSVVLGEELGRLGCNGVAMSIAIQTDMATPSLARFGSLRLKEQFLRPALAGQAVAAVAVTEPHAGSDVGALSTLAIRDGDDWVLTGTKTFITNGAQADWVCVLARTSREGGTRGMSQIIVPSDVPGFSVARRLDKLGGRSVDTVELRFEECRVPVANTIGEPGRGFQQQMQQFDTERMISSYVAVGEASGALERTMAFLAQRVVFGRPLIESQHVQFTLASLLAELDMLRQYNYACAESLQAGQGVGRMTAVAKLIAGRLQRKVADQCLQLHGGLGYMEDHWTARHFRDARLLSIGGGADEVMLRILARHEGMPVAF